MFTVILLFAFCILKLWIIQLHVFAGDLARILNFNELMRSSGLDQDTFVCYYWVAKSVVKRRFLHT